MTNFLPTEEVKNSDHFICNARGDWLIAAKIVSELQMAQKSLDQNDSVQPGDILINCIKIIRVAKINLPAF
jgi:hypothetical protein